MRAKLGGCNGHTHSPMFAPAHPPGLAWLRAAVATPAGPQRLSGISPLPSLGIRLLGEGLPYLLPSSHATTEKGLEVPSL